MTKKSLLLLALLFAASSMVFAQAPDIADTSAVAQAHSQWKAIAAGFSMAIASSLCGLAQGKAVASAVEGMARNPGAAKSIQLAMLIGLAFIESLALYTLLIVFMKVL
jgi:F-type H+-transporting ATPase subunit c